VAAVGSFGVFGWRRVERGEAVPGTLPLIVDSGGTVLEASRGNVFLVRVGALITPPADGRILPGVTRRLVLELAVDAGLIVSRRAVSPADLRAATEVFVTGAVRGVEPVHELADGPEWPEGAIATLMAARLRRRWEPVEEEAPWRGPRPASGSSRW
jgi:para-aminobenzoate synthetase/4-amino-4-deoxychorismate lyase